GKPVRFLGHVLANLTERRFRALWAQTDKNVRREELRFVAQGFRLLLRSHAGLLKMTTRSRGSLFIFRSPPAVAPPLRYFVPGPCPASAGLLVSTRPLWRAGQRRASPCGRGIRVVHDTGFARDHGLPALRDVHLLVNVLHSDVLVSARS